MRWLPDGHIVNRAHQRALIVLPLAKVLKELVERNPPLRATSSQASAVVEAGANRFPKACWAGAGGSKAPKGSLGVGQVRKDSSYSVARYVAIGVHLGDESHEVLVGDEDVVAVQHVPQRLRRHVTLILNHPTRRGRGQQGTADCAVHSAAAGVAGGNTVWSRGPGNGSRRQGAHPHTIHGQTRQRRRAESFRVGWGAHVGGVLEGPDEVLPLVAHVAPDELRRVGVVVRGALHDRAVADPVENKKDLEKMDF